MAAFVTALEVEQVPGRSGDTDPKENVWRLLAPLRYQSDVAAQEIWVPRGFVTDFASVPRLPVAYLLAGNTAHGPAVVHDWCYGTHPVTKDVADLVFLEAMGVWGEPWWRKSLMYHAVSWFGGSAYASGPSRLTIDNPTIAFRS